MPSRRVMSLAKCTVLIGFVALAATACSGGKSASPAPTATASTSGAIAASSASDWPLFGYTAAIDASSGRVLWRYTPAGYSSWAGTAQITTATPAADPGRKWIYAASPDGRIQKLSVADGHLAWRTRITLLPSREKIASALNYWHGRVIATTGGYIGDAPPYQGHVALLAASNGTLLSVWN